MIELNEAIKIFHDYIKNSIIGSVVDVGHSFVLWESDEDGDCLETSAIAINKSTGKIEAYFEPDHWDELENAKKIDYTEIKRS